MEKVWNKFLTDRDRAVFAASGYGTHGGFGQKPALLIIDVSYGFTGDRSEPILESNQALAEFVRCRGLGRRQGHKGSC